MTAEPAAPPQPEPAAPPQPEPAAPPAPVALSDVADLFGRACSGDRRALGRLLTYAERGGDRADAVAVAAWPVAGSAHIVGITGAPGVGKSTLTDCLAQAAAADGRRVAILAVDPSSPLTGGAILGDRVRMGSAANPDGPFVRSMASRGQSGGLALAALAAVRLLDATGHDLIIVETVGIGQVEVDIARTADTTIVAVSPGWGDAVQANKAGLLEMADIFVVNKADRPGAADARRDLEYMLDLGHRSGWRPPVTLTVATDRRRGRRTLEARAGPSPPRQRDLRRCRPPVAPRRRGGPPAPPTLGRRCGRRPFGAGRESVRRGHRRPTRSLRGSPPAGPRSQ